MEFRFTPEEEELVKEVHDFLEEETTPELLAESLELGGIYGGPESRKIVPKMGALGPLFKSKAGKIKTVLENMELKESEKFSIGAKLFKPVILFLISSSENMP